MINVAYPNPYRNISDYVVCLLKRAVSGYKKTFGLFNKVHYYTNYHRTDCCGCNHFCYFSMVSPQVYNNLRSSCQRCFPYVYWCCRKSTAKQTDNASNYYNGSISRSKDPTDSIVLENLSATGLGVNMNGHGNKISIKENGQASQCDVSVDKKNSEQGVNMNGHTNEPCLRVTGHNNEAFSDESQLDGLQTTPAIVSQTRL